MDPHAVLGVARGASDKEIKAAYRAAAMRWHPDRNASMDAAAASVAAEQFKRVSDAYERLRRGDGHGVGVRAGASSRYQQNDGRGRYYGGTDDPFGFRAREHVTGNARRRVDRNLRVLYVSLAFLGMTIYLAPTAPSPAEMSRARRRREASTRKRASSRFSSSSSSSSSSTTITDKATNRLALGSPLFAAEADVAGSSRDRYLGESELRASLSSRGGGEEGADAPEWARGGYAGRGIRRRVLPYHARGRGRMRSRHVEYAGADVGADVRAADADDDDETNDDGTSTRCARCGHALPLVRRCPICGAPTTRPDSVVVVTRVPTGVPTGVPARVPIADAQDTGSNVGRGRERARAAAAAAAAEPPKPTEEPDEENAKRTRPPRDEND
jgi:curved DNA-binding protein CbpA